MELVALSEHTGAEVRDVDLRVPLALDVADALRRALVERHLLVFRGQDLSVADQQRAGALFGDLVDEAGDGERHVFVSNARDDGVLAAGKPLLFHSDNMFTDAPLAVNALYGLVVDGAVAPTRFVNAERAYEQLDEDTRAQLVDAEALHLSGFAGGWYRYRDAEVEPQHPRATHPVLLRNPRTGNTVLAVSEQQTDRIIGWDPARSEAMLAALWEVLYRPDDIVTHEWRTGDLVVWDNLALQHGRPDGVGQGERTLRRVAMVEGDTDSQHPWTSVALAIDSRSNQ